jgi:hypothetical protein
MRFCSACFLFRRSKNSCPHDAENRPLPAAATSASTIGLQSLLHLEGHDHVLAEPGRTMRTSPEGASPGQIETALTGGAAGEAAR